jgi:hypothetical protein
LNVLVIDKKWRFTYDEITDVVIARVMQPQVALILCGCCGRLQLVLNRDMGLSAKWAPASRVIDRLQRGFLIDGRLD